MYGSTMNLSLAENDGKYELGYQYKDSNGIDMNHNIKSDSYQKLISEAIRSFNTNYSNQMRKLEEDKKAKETEKKQDNDSEKIAQLEKQIKELIAENDKLKINNKILQHRMDDTVNQTMKKKEENPTKTKHYDPLQELFDLFL